MAPTRLASITAVAIATLTTASGAHVDDPKARALDGSNHPPGWVNPGLAAAAGGVAQNVELMAHVEPFAFGTGAEYASDCWGYVSPAGREYAIIGLRNAVAFVDITTPSIPILVHVEEWLQCVWYDMSVFEDHAYIVNECGGGVRIYDLSAIDSGTVSFVRDLGTSDSHNVVIDTESGFLYQTGGAGYGLAVLDLNQNKQNPPQVATWTDRYVHDAYAFTRDGREYVICNSGFNNGSVESGLDILDVTDKADLRLLRRYEYPGAAYSHQGCLSADGNLFYMGDESDGFGGSYIIDVSDLADPSLAGTFSSGLPATDHNQYVRGSLIFQANYQSGLQVFDAATDPLAPVRVGFYDTYLPNDNSGFAGLWSCWPYFPSGTVIGSGSGGLWVWRTPLIQTCPEDLDGSGDVDFNDVLAILGNWGPCAPCPEDLDGDEVVGFDDLLAVLAAWGPCGS